MSMSAAISNFQMWRERLQARQDHDRLVTEDDHPLQNVSGDEEETAPSLSSPSSSVAPTVETVSEDEEEDVENAVVRAQENTERGPPVAVGRERPTSLRRTFTLADLEEERDLARRRTSACVLIAVFILFRLWIQAVATGDFGLLMLCLVGTSWTARFIRHTREREEELDRLIAEYHDNGDGEISANNLHMLSFQAQLAMAILESQRQMMQGGFGHPDGGEGTPGVSEQAKARWDRFKFKLVAGGDRGRYGSVPQEDDLEKGKSEEEEPHCSICLCEYEEGDALVCLPCKHIYHEDCVSSWCSNHVRCPLCNFDLESVSDNDSATREV